MHINKLLILSFPTFLFAACQTKSSQTGNKQPKTTTISDTIHKPSATSVAPKPADSFVVKIAGNAQPVIIPGKAIGSITIGSNPGELMKIIGRPQNSDAAMCKSLSGWRYDKVSPKEFDIAAECDPHHQMQPRIKWIRTTDSAFRTASGLGVGSTLQEIQAVFSKVAESSSYVDSNHIQMQIWNSPLKHIAFEVTAAKAAQICKAVVVYKATGNNAELYLPFYEYMKTNWK